MTKPDPAPPSSRRPQSEELRRRILGSAIDLFARQGVGRTTTREIAALARNFLAVNGSFLMMRVMIAPAAYPDDEAEIAALAKLFAAGARASPASGSVS